MNALLINLVLENPLLLTGVGNGDENSGRTMPYIPGSVLRGALIHLYRPGITADLFSDDQAKKIFFSCEVRFLNAYPQVAGKRSTPLPVSWRKAKGAEDAQGTEIVDYAFKLDPDKDTRPGKWFFSEAGQGKVVLLNPKKVLNLHIGGEGRGRVKRGNNTVFQYEALDAGQVFVAAILAEQKNDLVKIRNMLDKSPILFLGRSRSAEYGQARISKIEPEEGCREDWKEFPFQPNQELTTITLLSDVILRDEAGQPTLDFDSVLGKTLNRRVKNIKAFVQPTLVGGFNRKWSLPLIQSPALGMGSVFVYQAREVPPKEIETLVENGIGERIAEGFGRLAVNWPGIEKIKLADNAPASLRSAVKLSSGSQKIAKGMADRLLRRRLDDLLLQKSGDLIISGRIQNHQLSRLRSVALRALALPDKPLKPILDFMDEKRLKEAARKQFKTVRVGNERLFFWVRERAEKADALEAGLLNIQAQGVPVLAGTRAEIPDKLKREYTLRLIEAVVDRKMKQNRQEGAE